MLYPVELAPQRFVPFFLEHGGILTRGCPILRSQRKHVSPGTRVRSPGYESDSEPDSITDVY